MPKIPRLIPKQQKNGTWLLDISAKVSPTGKRQRLFFERKKLAELEAERLIGQRRKWGTESNKITAALAEDAAKAAAILAGRDCSLTQAAQHWLDWKVRQEKSVTFAALWEKYVERKEGEVSEVYLQNMRRYSAPLLDCLGKKLVCDITPEELEEALAKHYRTPRQFDNASRTIRPAFSFALRKSYIAENPFTRIEPRKLRQGAICIATLKECRAIFAACRNLKGEKKIPDAYKLDCSGCVPAVALMLFAGIRPKEIEKLEWHHIDFDHDFIKVDETVAKTRSTRIITMERNLAAWLLTVPAEERSGRIIPASWGAKIKAVRHMAGIGHKQDVMRHSFASYHLAAYADIKALQESMGHSTKEMILKHYRALVPKADAIKFWQITPEGSEIEKLEVVA